MLITINLLPVTQKNQRQQKRLNSKVLTICIILILAFVGASVFLYSYLASLNFEADSTKQNLLSEQSRSKKYSQTETALKKLSIELGYKNDISTNGIDWNEFILKFSNIIPEKVQITNFSARTVPVANIDITGTANSRREAIVFLEKMKTTPFFKETTLKSLDKSGTDEDITFTFAISAKIVNAKIAEQK